MSCSEDTMIDGANVSRSAQKKECFYRSEAWWVTVIRTERRGLEAVGARGMSCKVWAGGRGNLGTYERSAIIGAFP
jgi:hypothetical protein